jgi:hypothetical protein
MTSICWFRLRSFCKKASVSKKHLKSKHLNSLPIAKEDCVLRSLVEKEEEIVLDDEKMNDSEEDIETYEDDETEEKGVAKESLTSAQRVRLKMVCDQLGGKYRAPVDLKLENRLPKVVSNKKMKDDGKVVERNGDKQR